MENQSPLTKKKKFSMPHTYLLLFIIIAICTVATWVLPAGEFERIVNDANQSIVVPGTWHRIEAHPVSLFEMMQSFCAGMESAASIIFVVFLCYAGFGMIIQSGAINGAVNKLLGVLKGKIRAIIIPLFMIVFGASSSTLGIFEEALPFIPIFVIVAMDMGYDALVGMAIVALGVGIGYSGAAMNPYTVGVAQSIAGVPYMSGAGYRVICHIVMVLIASAYTIHYALKVQADPTRSLVYGDDFSRLTDGNMKEQKYGTREKLVMVVLIGGIVLLAFGVIKFHWYFQQLSAVVVTMGIISGLIMGLTPNDIAKQFAKCFGDVAESCLMIGIAKGILYILQTGKIVDTIVYGASIPLTAIPAILGGAAMVIFQTLLNFLIPSGSGQAVTSMPIMAPLADLMGISRQVSVLAFQFGDGLSNILWPTAFAPIICGMAGVKLEKWWKWFVPLFLMLLAAQIVLVIIAILFIWH